MALFRDWLLSEMFVHSVSTDPNFVIAFQQNLWLVNYAELTDKTAETILATILKNHPHADALWEKLIRHRSSMVNSLRSIHDYIPDVLIAWWDPQTKQLATTNEVLWPGTSVLIKKVAQALKATKINYSYFDDNEKTFSRASLKGQWPEIMYHGTSSMYLSDILQQGIRPMPHQTNYQTIIHKDKVFLSANLYEARQHAFHTAKETRGIPVVLAARIPDTSRLVPDYDVDRAASRSSYNHDYAQPTFWSIPSKRATRQSGVVGYQGRIPAKYIDHLEIYSWWKKRWENVYSMKKFIRRMEQDDELWYIKFGDPSKLPFP